MEGWTGGLTDVRQCLNACLHGKNIIISHKARNTYLNGTLQIYSSMLLFNHSDVLEGSLASILGKWTGTPPQIWSGVRRLILMFPEFLFVVCIVCIWYCGINA